MLIEQFCCDNIVVHVRRLQTDRCVLLSDVPSTTVTFRVNPITLAVHTPAWKIITICTLGGCPFSVSSICIMHTVDNRAYVLPDLRGGLWQKALWSIAVLQPTNPSHTEFLFTIPGAGRALASSGTRPILRR